MRKHQAKQCRLQGQRSKSRTASQWLVWGKRSTPTARTGRKGLNPPGGSPGAEGAHRVSTLVANVSGLQDTYTRRVRALHDSRAVRTYKWRHTQILGRYCRSLLESECRTRYRDSTLDNAMMGWVRVSGTFMIKRCKGPYF